MSVLSQDTFVIPGVVISNASGGGGGGGSVPANLSISSLTVNNAALATDAIKITNPTNERFSRLTTDTDGTYLFAYSSIATTGPASIQMGQNAFVPGEAIVIVNNTGVNAAALILTDTGVATSSLTVSSINGAKPNLPYVFESATVPADKIISSMNTAAAIGILKSTWVSTMGASITPFISTIGGQRFLQSGVFALEVVGGSLPPGTPNAYLEVFAGCGIATGQATNNIYPYPYISTNIGVNQTGNGIFSYIAGSAGVFGTQSPSGFPSTVNYSILLSPDWPVPIKNVTSTFVSLSGFDLSPITAIDLGQVNLVP